MASGCPAGYRVKTTLRRRASRRPRRLAGSPRRTRASSQTRCGQSLRPAARPLCCRALLGGSRPSRASKPSSSADMQLFFFLRNVRRHSQRNELTPLAIPGWGHGRQRAVSALLSLKPALARSLLTSEVKRRRAQLVLGWGTTWEHFWALSAFIISLFYPAVRGVPLSCQKKPGTAGAFTLQCAWQCDDQNPQYSHNKTNAFQRNAAHTLYSPKKTTKQNP